MSFRFSFKFIKIGRLSQFERKVIPNGRPRDTKILLLTHDSVWQLIFSDNIATSRWQREYYHHHLFSRHLFLPWVRHWLYIKSCGFQNKVSPKMSFSPQGENIWFPYLVSPDHEETTIRANVSSDFSMTCKINGYYYYSCLQYLRTSWQYTINV